ncbi:hypothetical protein GCM10020219_069390 [Nonomuraea dietziae]
MDLPEPLAPIRPVRPAGKAASRPLSTWVPSGQPYETWSITTENDMERLPSEKSKLCDMAGTTAKTPEVQVRTCPETGRNGAVPATSEPHVNSLHGSVIRPR